MTVRALQYRCPRCKWTGSHPRVIQTFHSARAQTDDPSELREVSKDHSPHGRDEAR